jgi:hypothetical protein
MGPTRGIGAALTGVTETGTVARAAAKPTQREDECQHEIPRYQWFGHDGQWQ